MSDQPANLWAGFCQRWEVQRDCVPLFSEVDGVVQTKQVGLGSRRTVLMRSPEMENLVLTESAKLLTDWEAQTHRYDGLIYFVAP